MDAHPDFTITRSVYGAQFGQSPLRLGGGLKNWRPFKLAGAHHDTDGHLIGGRLAYAENDQIADFSLVQYIGTEPNPKMDVTKAHYVYNGEELGFYEYVRVAVSGGRMDFNPVYELKATMKTLCNDLGGPRAICRPRHQGRHRRQAASRAPAGQHLRLGEPGMGDLFHAVARRPHQGGLRAIL